MKKSLILGIFAAVLLAIMPSIVLAEGGEGQCPDNLVYNPPPYIGNLTFDYYPTTGCAYITGGLELAGNNPNEIRPKLIEVSYRYS